MVFYPPSACGPVDLVAVRQFASIALAAMLFFSLILRWHGQPLTLTRQWHDGRSAESERQQNQRLRPVGSACPPPRAWRNCRIAVRFKRFGDTGSGRSAQPE